MQEEEEKEALIPEDPNYRKADSIKVMRLLSQGSTSSNTYNPNLIRQMSEEDPEFRKAMEASLNSFWDHNKEKINNPQKQNDEWQFDLNGVDLE